MLKSQRKSDDPVGYGEFKPGRHTGRAKVFIPASREQPKHSEGSLIQMADGRMLFFWAEFLEIDSLDPADRPADTGLRKAAYTDDGYARISAMESMDGGQTWSTPWVVADDRDAKINCIAPAAAVLPDGRIMLVYSWRSGGIYDGKMGSAERRIRLSSDGGIRWTSPMRITPERGYHTGAHDRLRILRSGRIIIPCHTILKPGTDQEMAVYTAYSDDCGKSWKHSNILIEPRKRRLEEGCLVEREDGSLLMIMRTYLGQGFYAESFNDGETWEKPYPSGVVASAAPTCLHALFGGRLLMIWNPDFNPAIPWSRGYRCPLLLAISSDGGRRWGLPMALETDPRYWCEYPGICLDEQHAWIHYRRVRRDRKRSDLMLCKLPLQELERLTYEQ